MEIARAYEDANLMHRLIDDLVRRRELLGLSQTQVARRMGTTQPAVKRFESEDSDPRLATVQLYARAVGARLDAAITGVNPAD